MSSRGVGDGRTRAGELLEYILLAWIQRSCENDIPTAARDDIAEALIVDKDITLNSDTINGDLVGSIPPDNPTRSTPGGLVESWGCKTASKKT